MSASRLLALTFALFCAATVPVLRAQVFEGRELVKAELLANTNAVVPGKPFTIGLHLRMVPGWHTYWKFPGDAGIPTEIKWKLPAGWKAGEIQWPMPLKLNEPGDIQIYGYHDEVLLMQEITPPASIAESLVRLEAETNWLVCERLCIPGSKDLALEVPIGAAAAPANDEIFTVFRRQLPRSRPNDATIEWSKAGADRLLKVEGKDLANRGGVDFYPAPPENVVVGHPTVENTDEANKAIVRIPIESGGERLSSVPGILVVGAAPKDGFDSRNAWDLSSPPSESANRSASAQTVASRGLASFLFFGFLGGFILNLMPCVLPVISLKIFGFIQHAGSDRRRILMSGLAFVAGIFVWFIALAVLLIAIKRAGGEIGWAVQFTNPYFVLGMSVIVLVFALNLFGVFEITLPQTANRGVMSWTSGEGHLGSFLQGVFATILGTSCTAPVLGTAVGFALTQSNAVILLMFAAIAAGMSAPYLLLSAQPAWVKLLPKPGAWMERVKQLMGFPMLATLVFLLYVLGQQRGPDAVTWALCFLLVVGLVCWMKGAFILPTSSTPSRILVLLLMLVLVLGSGHYFIREKFSQTRLASASEATTGDWQSFTPEKLDAALKENRAVFIDFTAAWCITCKFNEGTVLESSAVREAFARRNIVKFKADWTNADPAITKMLQQFGRPGVPLYVLYPGGKSAEPIVLPELLTKNIVLEKLETIAPQVAGK